MKHGPYPAGLISASLRLRGLEACTPQGVNFVGLHSRSTSVLASVRVDRSPYGSRLPSEPICGSPSSLPNSGETVAGLSPAAFRVLGSLKVRLVPPTKLPLCPPARPGFRHHKFHRAGYRMYGPCYPPARIIGGAVLGFTGQEEKKPDRCRLSDTALGRACAV